MDLLFTDISVLSPLLRRDDYWTSGGCCRRKVQERGVTPSWVEWRAKVSFGGTDAFWRISRLLTWLPSRTLTHCMHALAHTCRHKQWCGNGKVRPHPFDSTVCADKLTGSCKINTCTRKYVNISSRWKHCNWNGLLAQRLQCSWNGPKKIKSGFRRNQCYSEQSFFGICINGICTNLQNKCVELVHVHQYHSHPWRENRRADVFRQRETHSSFPQAVRPWCKMTTAPLLDDSATVPTRTYLRSEDSISDILLEVHVPFTSQQKSSRR